MQDFIIARQSEIIELCRTHHVRRLSIFGSAVRDDFDPETSDVDLRIEFEEHDFDGYFQNFDALHDKLTQLLNRKVDLITAEAIRNKRLRKIIEAAEVTLYAA